MDSVDATEVANQFKDAFKHKSIVEDLDKRYLIDRVEFGVMSGEDITKYSLMEVHNRELYDMNTREPFIFGCLDRRLGVSNKTSGQCKTCHQSINECTGHFGFVRLCLPVFHIGYFKHTIAILTCICKECSRLLFEEDERERYLKRMRGIRHDPLARKLLFRKMVVEARSLTSCPHCKAVNGPVRKFVGQPLKVYHEVNGKRLQQALSEENVSDQYRMFLNRSEDMGGDIMFRGKCQEELNPLRVKMLLEAIPEEDWEVLDVINPSSLLITHAVVPPVCIRPSVVMGDAGTNEDDITIKISEIVNCNALLRGLIAKGSATRQVWDNWDFLSLQCALIVNGDIPGLPPGVAAKPSKGISQRLKGKEGRFRGNLSGKRVDFSGRTVISPDPNLGIDEVAVPHWMAKRLTFPEAACEVNIDRLRAAILRGAEAYPGAQFVTKKLTGQKSMLRYGNRRQLANDLQFGDVVDRHLIDGDIVLFNRQPSLHRMSIMAHRARILPWRTLRFNECCCQPYNADFDGDEMNIHVPQTFEARAEALHLMGVTNNLVTPKNGEPLIACTQDFLTGSYLLNQKNTFLNRAQAAQFAAHFSDGKLKIRLPPPCIIKPLELWSGKQLFSLLLRPNESSAVAINIDVKEREFSGENPGFMCPVDGWVLIRDSELLAGAPGKTTLGGAKNGLIFRLIRDNGPHSATVFLSRIAKATSRWLMNMGMTIGLDDVTPNSKVVSEKAKMMAEGHNRVEDFIQQYSDSRLASKPGCTPEQTLEAFVKGTLDELRDKAGQVCKKQLKRTNKPLMMFLCGSKGQLINTAQMVACVGQQNVGGQRIKNGFVSRTLPHFLPGSRDAAARGFVQNSFYSGLTPTEFFFHTMSGREGLVDTAVKTADTGYMQRRLMKALEDLSCNYDLSVRTSAGQIVQFVYGDDGLNPAMMEAKTDPIEFEHVWQHTTQILRAERRNSKYKDECARRNGSRTCDEEAIHSAKLLGVTPENSDFVPAVFPAAVDILPRSIYPFGSSTIKPKKTLSKTAAGVNSSITQKSLPIETEWARRLIVPPAANRFGRIRELAARVIKRTASKNGSADVFSGLTSSEIVAVVQVYENLSDLNKSRIKSIANANETDALCSALSSSKHESEDIVFSSAVSKGHSLWLELIRALEAELSVALIPSELSSVPLLPGEAMLWVEHFIPRVSHSLPKTLDQHMKTNLNEKETHQILTKTLRTFSDDLKRFLAGKLIASIVTSLSTLGLESNVSDSVERAAEILSSIKQSQFLKSKGETDNIMDIDEETELPLDWTRVQRCLRNKETDVTPRGLLEFLRLSWKKYFRALMQPGDAAGAIAGQSIGEPGTQMTLKTFHFAGVASMNVTLGVPRIKEIINAARSIDTPIMHIRLSDPTSELAARMVKSRIEKTTLGDILAGLKEVLLPQGERRFFLSVKIDMDTVLSLGFHDLTIEDVAQKILAHPPLIKLKIKQEHIVIQDERKLFITPPSNDRDAAFFILRAIKAALPSVCVRGIPTTVRGVVNIHDENPKEQPWYDVFVEGYGLREVMAVGGVVGTQTTTNHIDEVYRVLGIEAARVTIAKEIKACMDAYSMDIDMRHMLLLADVMTNKGEVLGINRFGIAKMRASTLLLASFEETNEHLFEAAAHSRADDVHGVSECIILGKPVKLGTGAFSLLHDINRTQSSAPGKNSADEQQPLERGRLQKGKRIVEEVSTDGDGSDVIARSSSPTSDQSIHDEKISEISEPSFVCSVEGWEKGKFGFPTRKHTPTIIARFRAARQNRDNDIDMDK